MNTVSKTPRRRLTALKAIALGLSVLLPATAQAAQISTVQTEVGPIITIVGEIIPGDDRKFDATLATYPNARVVYMRSEGGEVSAALNIGITINERQMRAVVQDGDYCLSACALAWLGSPSRTLYSQSQVGFHAAWRTESGGTQEDGVGNAMIGHYIKSIGLPLEAVIFATSASPTNLSYIPTQHSSWRGIDFIVEGVPQYALHKYVSAPRNRY